MPVKFEGGGNFKAMMETAQIDADAKGYDVGFYATSKYQDGTAVTNVAADNEFGVANAPERPFFRNANKSVEPKLIRLIKKRLENNEPITRNTVGLMGDVHKGEVQKSITDLKSPPNAPSTIAAKGSSNPLIDTGFMRDSVAWKEEV